VSFRFLVNHPKCRSSSRMAAEGANRWRQAASWSEPAFGDARVEELLTRVREAGLKPRSDSDLVPILLEMLGAVDPVENWPWSSSRLSNPCSRPVDTSNSRPGLCRCSRRQVNPRIGPRPALGTCPRCRTGPVTSSPAYFHVAVHRSGQPSDRSRLPRPASSETGTSSSVHAQRWDHREPRLSLMTPGKRRASPRRSNLRS